MSGVGTISEIHIDFATALNNDAANGGFHANSQGSPQPGHFDLNTTTAGSSWSTTISASDLADYLNVGSVPAHFYIAAHGVVNYATTGGAGTCPTLPNGKWRYLDWHPGHNYYVQGAKLYESNDLSSELILDSLNGWCVDRSRPVEGFNQDVWNQVDFLCSTEDLTGLCLVDKPENIKAVNWLLNNKTYAGTPSMVDIQVTIWELVSNNNDYSNYTYDAGRVATLKAAALEHSDFVPGCGQIIGSLMYSSNTNYCNGGGIQVILIERTVECGGGGSDTMWGFNIDQNGEAIEDESCRFVDQGNWARYFQF